MSATFPDYKGLNLPNIADQMLKFWEDHNIFDKSITTRNGKTHMFFLKARLLQMVCQVSTTF